MKTRFLTGLGLLALTAAASTAAPPNPLLGRWQERYADGSLMLLNFRADGTYDAFVNGKLFISAKYVVRQDTFAMSDGLCNVNYEGIYRLSFFAKDSVRFRLIQDTCRARRRGVDGLIAGRVKTLKP